LKFVPDIYIRLWALSTRERLMLILCHRMWSNKMVYLINLKLLFHFFPKESMFKICKKRKTKFFSFLFFLEL
ncbi:hypothetical protein, partial [Halomonas sp. PAR8]|uniref:hypothetical protein n=1 Tax=Halomonas sp. PAR8 TaxID=3075515 RepID=UPI002885D2B6